VAQVPKAQSTSVAPGINHCLENVCGYPIFERNIDMAGLYNLKSFASGMEVARRG